MSISRKERLIDQFHEAIGETIEDAGFEQISERKIKRTTGMSSMDLVMQGAGSVPYGMSKRSNVELSPSIKIYELSGGNLRCTRGDESLMLAMLMGFEPSTRIASDCGSVTLMVNAYGSCSRIRRESTREFIDDLISDSTDGLTEFIRRQ